MEKLSRVLAVLIAILSVAFMGFAGAVVFGGPNWLAEARALPGYTFSRAEGEPPIWSAMRAQGQVELPTKSPLLPEVLTAAIKDRADQARQERDRLAQELPTIEKTAQDLEARQKADVPALERYFQNRFSRLEETHRQIETASKQQEMLAVEVGKIEDQLDSRRQDVFRLELQYRLLDADVVQVDQNIAAIDEQIRLLEDELDKSQRRKQELDRQGLPAAR